MSHKYVSDILVLVQYSCGTDSVRNGVNESFLYKQRVLPVILNVTL
jgi:hypothetical protein